MTLHHLTTLPGQCEVGSKGTQSLILTAYGWVLNVGDQAKMSFVAEVWLSSACGHGLPVIVRTEGRSNVEPVHFSSGPADREVTPSIVSDLGLFVPCDIICHLLRSVNLISHP